METNAIEKDPTIIGREILNLEKKYWSAMKDHDLETALSLTDFPCIVAGAHGISSVDKEQFTEMFNSQNGVVRIFNFEEDKTEVRQIGTHTVVIAYQVQSSVDHDGQKKTIEAVDTSTWVKRDEKWLCAMHTETELVKKH